jgi:hypothetical protein
MDGEVRQIFLIRGGMGFKKKQEFAMELKIKRGKHIIEDGKEQLARYLDRLGLNEGYLVIFDPGDREWEEKIYMKEIDFNDKALIMVGV